MAQRRSNPDCGGLIHTYRKYDPQRFPMPQTRAPDLVSPAFEHLLAYGSLDHLTEEQLAEAIEIDPSQIAGFGPSIASLIAMLEERKRKILQTYETPTVEHAAEQAFHASASRVRAPRDHQEEFVRAIRDQQIVELEQLWYAQDQRGEFARQLVVVMEHLGNKYEIEDLVAKYVFTGRREMTIEQALEKKEALETIDRLIEQLKDAAKNAKIYLVNLEDLARFADQEQMEGLEALQDQVEQMLRHLAAEQGLKREGRHFKLTPKAFKLFQSKLLDQIFSDLRQAKTGRHHVEISGDGAVELQRTKPYEFGDSLANMDVSASMTNALVQNGTGLPIRLKPEHIEIHLTRNSPKCATVVCMDMSGSMRWGGEYINVKRMALALDGLIRSEYPGDYIDFVEIFSTPKRRHISEVPQLLPKPVTIHDPVVRLKVDLADDQITDFDIPPHFTNIQHGLRLARQLLQPQDTPNRQIILITDGLPTAHYEEQWLYLLYPPDRRTEHFTMREGMMCKNEGIVINIFLLSNWAQSEEDIQFAHRLAEQSGGRVMFAGGRELDRFVVWDYVRQRRYIIG